jgi:hypothetical protein
MSQSEAVVHLAMGDAAVADSIRVNRPGREPLILVSVPAGGSEVLHIPWEMEGELKE